MKYTIDRLEGEFAVIELEDQTILSVPRKILPQKSKEGDIILVSIDEEETKKRREKLFKMASSLFEEE